MGKERKKTWEKRKDKPYDKKEGYRCWATRLGAVVSVRIKHNHLR